MFVGGSRVGAESFEGVWKEDGRSTRDISLLSLSRHG